MRTMTPRIPLAALALAALVPACSTQTVYLSVMEMRKQECRKISDLAERARCEKEADRSYGEYKAETAKPRP
jgi:hypothetical protein